MVLCLFGLTAAQEVPGQNWVQLGGWLGVGWKEE